MLRFANPFLLLLLFFVRPTLAHEQLLLVVADDMNTPTGVLQRYDRHGTQWKRTGKAVVVNLGRNGLGWGIGATELPHDTSDPIKHEGDGRAPAGVFTLGQVFGYRDTVKTAMPYLKATSDLICIDDSRSKAYNRITPITPSLHFRSFEWMRREDNLYALGVVVQHNNARVPGRGSCIFLHIQRAPGAGTSGCTSMPAASLEAIARWLDPAKTPLLVQIPRKNLPEAQRLFAGIGE